MPRNQDVIAIYSRKSRFTGKGESIGNQVELCRAYIRTAFGDAWADRAVVFEDEGFSGGNLNRPDFRRMMQAARERRFRAVVVYRLDRISRNISDFSALIEELGRLGIDFISIRESFDTSSPMGRAMMYIASVFSQLERETIAERIRDNMHELAKTGRWLGGTTPTGYTSEAVRTVTVDGRSKRACRLRLLPEEAAVVREIYDLYGETDSLTGTEAELLRRQIRTKNGRSFTRFSIRGILQNPVYLIADRDAYQYFLEKQAELFSAPEEFDGVRGILAYNRTDQEKGRATVYRPVCEWIVSVGQHPGLIPGKAWVRVQESLERNKSNAYRKPRSNEALLTGLLWCRCGSRMYPKLSRRETAEGKRIFHYVCKSKERSKRRLCNGKNAEGNLLDGAVLAQIRELTGEKSGFLSRLEKSKGLYTGRTESERPLEELRQQQAENDRKIRALVDSLADFGDSTALDHLKKRIEELHAGQAELQERIGALEDREVRRNLNDREFDLLRQRLASFRDCVDSMTVEQKRAAVRGVVRKVVWDGQRARVVLWGAEEADDEQEPTLWGEDSK
ncbi:recombinase family protein [Subdoligranulum variabile]|uniref:Resolvase, N-terminal domain protein n=1 Tax=Subdoligranulum variabile DSM 15176 TaxID=411471 RepID=D1PPD5_9FIRM|nr:recombinase family protein [Subdoligranulum variabile]EFB75397.1 resolvase, N-terminal domain protein [Subdoligranulum variabile DSM 15176]UWP69069.1 recombinase family protein [Subdoligranulum variabile]